MANANGLFTETADAFLFARIAYKLNVNWFTDNPQLVVLGGGLTNVGGVNATASSGSVNVRRLTLQNVRRDASGGGMVLRIGTTLGGNEISSSTIVLPPDGGFADINISATGSKGIMTGNNGSIIYITVTTPPSTGTYFFGDLIVYGNVIRF